MVLEAVGIHALVAVVHFVFDVGVFAIKAFALVWVKFERALEVLGSTCYVLQMIFDGTTCFVGCGKVGALLNGLVVECESLVPLCRLLVDAA